MPRRATWRAERLSAQRTICDSLICVTIGRFYPFYEANRAGCMRSSGRGGLPAASAIVVDGLSKTYQVPEREGGFGAAVRSFFRRKHRDVQAVQHVSFQIGPGEVV